MEEAFKCVGDHLFHYRNGELIPCTEYEFFGDESAKGQQLDFQNYYVIEDEKLAISPRDNSLECYLRSGSTNSDDAVSGISA